MFATPLQRRSGSRLLSRTVVIGLLALLLTSFAIGHTQAAPVFDEHAISRTAGDSTSISFYSPPNMPPLPFRQPQIGPDIKRAYRDDVDLRTTAFVPQKGAFVPDFDIPDEDRSIRVDLSDQVVIAYEQEKPVRAFVISSGLPWAPTVTGSFRISRQGACPDDVRRQPR